MNLFKAFGLQKKEGDLELKPPPPQNEPKPFGGGVAPVWRTHQEMMADTYPDADPRPFVDESGTRTPYPQAQQISFSEMRGGEGMGRKQHWSHPTTNVLMYQQDVIQGNREAPEDPAFYAKLRDAVKDAEETYTGPGTYLYLEQFYPYLKGPEPSYYFEGEGKGYTEPAPYPPEPTHLSGNDMNRALRAYRFNYGERPSDSWFRDRGFDPPKSVDERVAQQKARIERRREERQKERGELNKMDLFKIFGIYKASGTIDVSSQNPGDGSNVELGGGKHRPSSQREDIHNPSEGTDPATEEEEEEENGNGE